MGQATTCRSEFCFGLTEGRLRGRPFFYFDMKKQAIIKLLTDFKESIDTYFNADEDAQGKSDAESVYDIFKTHVDYYTVYKETDDFEGYDNPPGITDIDDEGLNVSYDYGSVFNNGMLEKFDPISRIELLEGCIYALNNKLNELELDYKKRLHENRNNS